MKEPEFIELLNLYIDHEIGAEDSVRLEAEVVSNPERRRIYQQYCRMHRACCALAEEARTVSPEVERAGARRRSQWFAGIYAAGLMAAACFVVLAVVRFHGPSRVNSVARAPAVAGVVAAAPVRSPLHPVVDLRNLALSGENSGSGSLLSAEQNQLFAWMNQVQMAPVQRPSIDQVFNSPPVLLGSDNRVERTPEALPTPVEMAAFRFQR